MIIKVLPLIFKTRGMRNYIISCLWCFFSFLNTYFEKLKRKEESKAEERKG